MNVDGGGNAAIEAYVAALTDSRRERVRGVISYIRNQYAALVAGCAKIPDSVPFPPQHIKRAVDVCFKENDYVDLP
jgi:hypothetical protein